MTASSVDPVTGNLLVGGKPVFPIGLSDPPPLGSTAPSGVDAWTEVASGGVNFVRNYTVWTAAAVDEQIISVAQDLDAAPKHGLQVWLALAGIDDDLSQQAVLDKVVDAFGAHPALGAWKGADEPAFGRVPVAGLVAVYEHLQTLDPHHPVVIIEAPRVAGRDARSRKSLCAPTPRPATSTVSTSIRSPTHPGRTPADPPSIPTSALSGT